MHPWSILLLPVFFVILYAVLLSREARDSFDSEGWSRAFVKAALIVGMLVTASTEILSLFRALTGPGLVLFWSLAVLTGGGACWRMGALREVRRLLLKVHWSGLLRSLWLTAPMAAIGMLTLVVGWVSPANTTDSHLYHMTRVMHWAQAGSLAQYPTTYEHQLWFPPWAETAILTLRLLWGNDQPAALVQGLSYLGCLVLTAGVARLLGANRSGRLLASAFCLSIPMAVLQASSTQNDLVSAFWLLCLAYLVAAPRGQASPPSNAVYVGMAAGLGMLTKTTSYLYAAPFLGRYLLKVWRSDRLWTAGKRLGGAMLVVVALNAGYWTRNWTTYRTPIGSVDLLRGHVAIGGANVLATNLAAHLVSHFATPSEEVNRAVEAGFRQLSGIAGRRPFEFRLIWSWNHEDLAGSPLHLIGATLVLLMVLTRPGERGSDLLREYAAAGVLSFALLIMLVSWNPYVVRLHLPYLVIMAPLLGAGISRVLSPVCSDVLAAVLVLLALPWALLNQTRPVIGLRPRTAIVSVFRADREDILFANWLPQRDDYLAAVEQVRRTDCTHIGLRIDSHDLEYPFWWLLGAPQNGIRLEHIDPPPQLERYADPGFRPCAIVCMICAGRTELHGLERVGSYGEIAVFAGDGFDRENP